MINNQQNLPSNAESSDQPELVKAKKSLPKENIVPYKEEGKPLAEIQRMPEGTELAAEMPLSENVSLQNIMMPL